MVKNTSKFDIKKNFWYMNIRLYVRELFSVINSLDFLPNKDKLIGIYLDVWESQRQSWFMWAPNITN